MSTLRPEAAHRGHHTQEGWRGVWVPAGLDEGGGEISWAHKEGEGAPGYMGRGGQVRCRWFVALLIDKGAPKVA
jgi:hypothetical protein